MPPETTFRCATFMTTVAEFLELNSGTELMMPCSNAPDRMSSMFSLHEPGEAPAARSLKLISRSAPRLRSGRTTLFTMTRDSPR